MFPLMFSSEIFNTKGSTGSKIEGIEIIKKENSKKLAETFYKQIPNMIVMEENSTKVRNKSSTISRLNCGHDATSLP